jgi:tetratricopeptide (TPR) repeat protein
MELRDAATGEVVQAFHGQTKAVCALAWSPDGRRLASSASYDNAVKVWDVATGQEVFSLHGSPYYVAALTWSPDGKRLAGMSPNGTVTVWDGSVRGIWDPSLALAYNELAWFLGAGPDPQFRDPLRAVELARRAVERAPQHQVPNYWNTLGVAHYRAGEWRASIQALEKSLELQTLNLEALKMVAGHVPQVQNQQPGTSFDFFFLAMAHWQLSDKDKAREWYQKGVQWMDKNAPRDEELRRFRAEAEDLLCIKDAPVPNKEVPAPKD